MSDLGSFDRLQENLLIFPSERGDHLTRALKADNIRSGHLTNGVYSYGHTIVVPTVLAGFQYVGDKEGAKDAPLIVVVNSKKSMELLVRKKLEVLDNKIAHGAATRDDKQKLESEFEAMEDAITRAEKVAMPLSEQNPERRIIAVFHDEETPNALFASLRQSGLSMKSLFKWGYGTNPQAGVIEGAEYFDKVYGFPLPNDRKPVAEDITRKTGQTGNVTVIDLRTEVGPHGKPYISPQSECLFPLAGPLMAYGPRNNPPLPNATAVPRPA